MKKQTVLAMLLTLLCLLLIASEVFSQRYMTRTAKVTFFSSTPLENIEAVNNEAASAIDAKSGDVAFQVPVKSFRFEKALMQEHFNENYMESDKFPKAEFKGRLVRPETVRFDKDGTYNVTASGKLTMHGVTRDVTIPGTITVKGSGITASSKFSVRCADYGIKIPAVVAGKIAEQIEVTVNSIMSRS